MLKWICLLRFSQCTILTLSITLLAIIKADSILIPWERPDDDAWSARQLLSRFQRFESEAPGVTSEHTSNLALAIFTSDIRLMREHDYIGEYAFPSFYRGCIRVHFQVDPTSSKTAHFREIGGPMRCPFNFNGSAFTLRISQQGIEEEIK